MVHFLILAAGKGERAKKVGNNSPKQYVEFNNISPLRYLLKKITKIKEFIVNRVFGILTYIRISMILSY